MRTKPEKRISTWTFGDLSIPFDADEQWVEVKKSTFAEQLEAVAGDFFWMIQLPWMDMSLAVREKFLGEFTLLGKQAVRDAAVHGLKFVNNHEIFQLLRDAIECEKLRSSGKLKESQESQDFAMASFSMIGVKFSELAAKKDHRIFNRMADMMAAGGIGGTKGGEESFNGQVIRDFCQLVLNSRSLPTKKQIRESLGLSEAKIDTERLRIALKELGLGGLPVSR